MKKIVLFLMLFMIMAVLFVGCNKESDETNTHEEMIIQGEFFTFSNAESENIQVNTDEEEINNENENMLFDEEENLPHISGENFENINPIIRLVGSAENIPPPLFDVDVDFTTFSGDEFDDEYSNIIFWHTEDYIGKTMRIIGSYYGFFDNNTDRHYHFIFLEDSMGCCVRQFEFNFSEGNEPDEFPEESTIIDLTGVFGEYHCDFLDFTIQYLMVDSISIIRGGNLQ